MWSSKGGGGGSTSSSRIQLPSSPQVVARTFMGSMGASSSSQSRSPRALVLALAALIALVLFYQSHGSVKAVDDFGSFKALLSSSRNDHVPILPLDALPSTLTSQSESEGLVMLLSSDTTETELARLACDILKIRSQPSDKHNTERDPVALRHITFGLEDAREPFMSMQQAEIVLRDVISNGTCITGKSISQVQQPMTLRKVTQRSAPALVEKLAPLAVLYASGGKLQNAIEESVIRSAGGTIGIPMPQEDIEHAGWIFSLSLQALRSWHIPKFKAIVITNDRASSLKRLFRSLKSAHYFGKSVDLHIKVEASADDATIKTVMQMTSDRSTEAWSQGSSDIFFRFRQAGLICNIVEAWYPTSNDEYAFFFEDDIEASPFFFAWAKWAILTYRYGPDRDTDPARNIYGISLIQQMTSELDAATGRIMWSAGQQLRKAGKFEETSPYFSQVPSSWGAVYFPEHWREFHDYIQVRDGEEIVPRKKHIVSPWLVSDNWDGSWKRYLIELVYLRGYTMLYPNYAEWASLSTNHVELGEHIDPVKQAKLRKMQEVPLMQDNMILDVPNYRMAPVDQVPVFDLWGKSADVESIVTRGVARHKEIWHCATARPRRSDYNGFALFACL